LDTELDLCCRHKNVESARWRSCLIYFFEKMNCIECVITYELYFADLQSKAFLVPAKIY